MFHLYGILLLRGDVGAPSKLTSIFRNDSARIKLCIDEVEKKDAGQRLPENPNNDAYAHMNDDKCAFAEDELLKGYLSGSSIECSEVPSKRVKLSHDT
jgi:hypothetical protein